MIMENDLNNQEARADSLQGRVRRLNAREAWDWLKERAGNYTMAASLGGMPYQLCPGENAVVVRVLVGWNDGGDDGPPIEYGPEEFDLFRQAFEGWYPEVVSPND